MYKHWKKILLAMTAFFWNACDNNSTPTAPQVTPDSSSGTNIEPASSSTISPSSSEASSSATATNPASSSAVNATSSATPPPVSSAVGETSSSSVTAKSSSAVASSSSSVKEKVSSSSLDQNADLYGCPPDVCGAELSSSAGMIIAPKYGVPVMSSSSQGFEDVPLYGVSSNVCVKAENDSTLNCNGGVTCVESVTEKSQFPSCSGDQICAKYGVVIIKDKIYKCSDGKVYNEAEFKARYDMLTFVSKPEEKIPCYKKGDSMECDDGEFYDILKDDRGNVIYSNDVANLSEKEFLKKYEILEMAPALYGPPCMFTGTCDEEK